MSSSGYDKGPGSPLSLHIFVHNTDKEGLISKVPIAKERVKIKILF